MKYVTFTLALFAVTALAATVETKVQYVSASAVYLDAGRSSGVAQGDTVIITRDGSELIRLVVSFVADNSSSCELLNAPAIVRKDDAATVFVTVSAIAVEKTGEVQTYDATPSAYATRETVRPVDRPNLLTGRVSVGYAMQDDREPANFDYTEPTLALRAALENISGSDFDARVNLRLRRTLRSNDDLSSSTHRIYEAALFYEPQAKPLSAGVGRLTLRETRGMGYLDGAYAKYSVNSQWKFGAVGGIEPDLRNTRVQSDVTKLGAFASFESVIAGENSLQATASLAGRYLKGEISREFLYQQMSFARGSKLSVFESTEINLNRGWLKDAEGESFTLASFLFDARYNVSRRLGLAVGYDNRTNYYTAETRSIPDSVFASALQQGFRASLDTRFGDSYSAELGLAVRDGEKNFSKSSGGWFRVGSYNLLKSQVSANLRVRWFDSDYSQGTQPSLSISRDLTRWLSTGLQFGSNDYELLSTGELISQQWASILFDFRFDRNIYASTEFEQGFGDGRDATNLSLLLGYRF